MEGKSRCRKVWESAWHLAAKEWYTNLVHGRPNDPENIQKRAMAYISRNTILSIREEEIVPLGAITVDWWPTKGDSRPLQYTHISRKIIGFQAYSTENLSLQYEKKIVKKKDKTYLVIPRLRMFA